MTHYIITPGYNEASNAKLNANLKATLDASNAKLKETLKATLDASNAKLNANVDCCIA